MLNICTSLLYRDNKLFSFFEQFKATANFSALKYYTFIHNIDYFNYTYCGRSFDSGLILARHLNDLSGIQYLLNTFKMSYPDHLYPVYNWTYLELAIDLHDLHGIKVITKNLEQNVNHLTIYDKLDVKNTEQKIFYAIDIGDADGVKYLLHNQKISDIKMLECLRHAYYRERLDSALFILDYINNIKNSELITHIITSILRSNPTRTRNEYRIHFNKINSTQLSTTLLELLDSFNTKPYIIKSPYFNLNAYTSNTLCLNKLQSLFARADLHFTTREVINFIKINNIENNQLDIFLYCGNLINIKPFFSVFNINYLFKYHRIFAQLSDNSDVSLLIHELTHLFFVLLFNNRGFPYINSNFEMTEQYDIAVNVTLTNIAYNFTKGKYTDYNSREFKVLCWLNCWHLSAKQDINLTNTLIEKIYPTFSNITNNQKVLILRSKHRKFVEEFNWTLEHQYVLERIADYLRREKSERDSEFLVRITELYSKDLDKPIINNFIPMTEYWSQYITPSFVKYQNSHYNYCKESLLKNTNLNNCDLRSLSKAQSLDIIRKIISIECMSCLTENLSFLSAVPHIQLDKLLDDASTKIGYCVEYYCQKDKVDQLKPTKIFKTSILGEFLQTLDQCTSIYGNQQPNNKQEELLQIIMNVTYCTSTPDDIIGHLNSADNDL